MCVHRPFLCFAPRLSPLRARTLHKGFSHRASLQAKPTSPVAAKGDSPGSRILPDDTPLDVPPASESSFPWEGGESSRSLLLLDGNAILYRAYFKIMAKVQYGSLKDMGSEADWVLTVFTALSTIIRLLDTHPTHVAAAFDYNGMTFRHELFREYKSGRPPTPDTVCQALSCLKPALLSLGISVIEVAGVEADDVIATFALRAVAANMNVSIASPDKDFFQIISPQLRLLRFVPRGSGIVPFGVKEFQERFGDIHPSQYLEVLALQGDKVDSIPGLPGVGEITALKLVKEFKTVENLLQNREKVKLKRPRMSLMADDGGVLLSKKLLTLRTDISNHLVPHTLEDLLCQSPKDKGEQFVALVNAMGAYVDSSISEDILDRAAHLWEKWDSSMESIL
jgi:5'-3' exonuclease